MSEVADSGGYYSGGVSAAYTNWANAPTTDNTLNVDANGNNTSDTVSAGNRVTFDGTYTYEYDAEGNRIAKWINNSGGPDPRHSPAPRTSRSTAGTTATA